MTLLHAVLFALVQGITELFPVSSLGHAVLLPRWLGWNLDQAAADFLPFLVVLHVGTATALLLYFWRDWFSFLSAVLRPTTPQRREERRLFGLVCVATLPALVLGYALHQPLRALFARPLYAAIFLILNGFILYFGDRLRRRFTTSSHNLASLNWQKAVSIGAAQALALLPGISRSGVSMVGGLLAGLNHESAARFSFLLATPIICGAAVLEVPKLLHSGSSFGAVALVSGVVAGVAAYASIMVMLRYFKKHEFQALTPFAWYCWVVGAASLLFF